ncbi:MAG TPA: DUF4190 domain-containing protein, partial [Polyangiales bacterium]|nr:DUF4190 domain-containing protein [Polyangiales bacterium]
MVQDDRTLAPVRATATQSDPQNLAVGALLCALGGIFCFFTSIGAIVLGHMARAQGKATPERRGVALATVALVIAYAYLGVVVGATVASLVLLPTMMKHAGEQMSAAAHQASKAQAREEAEEAKRNAPAPVERGPLPARLGAELPFNNAARAKDP